jgi:hypothetical protein
MSDHYEFMLAFDLKLDTPSEVIEILRYMTGQTEELPPSVPDHPFFEMEKNSRYGPTWQNFLRLPSHVSGAFPGYVFARCDLKLKPGIGEIYKDYNVYTFSCRMYVHEDSFANLEPQAFLDWLLPHINIDDLADDYPESVEMYWRNSEHMSPPHRWIGYRREWTSVQPQLLYLQKDPDPRVYNRGFSFAPEHWKPAPEE